MHMTKKFHCMKVVESFISKNPPLTNNLCYPRIKKKLMFCETSDQHLLANIITCLSDADIPAGKKLCEKGDFRKIVPEDFLSHFCKKRSDLYGWPI